MTVTSGTATGRFGNEVHRDSGEFGDLREEWGELYEHCPSATPFQSWEWLYTWWEHYGGDYELRLITLREPERGALVGLLPLMLDPRPGASRLLFIGTGITDYLDVLVREGWEEEVSRSGARALKELDGWAVADLQELRPEAAGWGLIDSWNGPMTSFEQSTCLFLEADESWDQQLTKLSTKFRSNVRRSLRKAEGEGVRRKQVADTELEKAMERLLVLHRTAWEGRRINPEHLTDRFESHMRVATQRLSLRGSGIVLEYHQGGEVLVSSFVVVCREFVGGYLEGHQKSARNYEIKCLQTQGEAEVARERGARGLDFLRGDEPHKLRWRPEYRVSRRVLLGRRRIPYTAYATYHRLYEAARRAAKQENPAWWIRMGLRLRELPNKRKG